MSKYAVETTRDPHVVAIEFPIELLDAMHDELSDKVMKRIVDFRKYGDEQLAYDYFELLMDLTRTIRHWATNSRSPF